MGYILSISQHLCTGLLHTWQQILEISALMTILGDQDLGSKQDLPFSLLKGRQLAKLHRPNTLPGIVDK